MVHTPLGRPLLKSEGDNPAKPGGVFFGWADVNGVDFWSAAPAGEVGEIVPLAPEPEVIVRPKGIEIAQSMQWIRPDGSPLLHERRLLKVPIPEEQSIWYFDWIAELTAREQTVLGCGQKAMGLSLGFANAVSGGIFRDSRYRSGVDVESALVEWMAYEAPDAACGAAIMQGRRSPRPRSEYHLRQAPPSMISAAFAYHAPYVIPAGETLALKYRIGVYDGPIDMTALHVLYSAFLWS